MSNYEKGTKKYEEHLAKMREYHRKAKIEHPERYERRKQQIREANRKRRLGLTPTGGWVSAKGGYVYWLGDDILKNNFHKNAIRWNGKVTHLYYTVGCSTNRELDTSKMERVLRNELRYKLGITTKYVYIEQQRGRGVSVGKGSVLYQVYYLSPTIPTAEQVTSLKNLIIDQELVDVGEREYYTEDELKELGVELHLS